VLVVGERPEQASSLAERLGILGIEAIPSAREWKLTVRCLTSHKVSLIVLDVGAEDESRQFFQAVREVTDIPIVARGSIAPSEPAVWYLNNGALDYVARTTPVAVLAAKIKSLVLAVSSGADASLIRRGDLVIDPARYSVTLAGEPIALTPIEFRLLRVLAENAGKACSHQTLLDRVWGEDFRYCSHYLRLYIGYLRQKLEASPARPKIIVTEWGYGYRLIEPIKQDKPATIRRVRYQTATG
jgi:two-component system KDP operon response regulator KdpE